MRYDNGNYWWVWRDHINHGIYYNLFARDELMHSPLPHSYSASNGHCGEMNRHGYQNGLSLNNCNVKNNVLCECRCNSFDRWVIVKTWKVKFPHP